MNIVPAPSHVIKIKFGLLVTNFYYGPDLFRVKCLMEMKEGDVVKMKVFRIYFIVVFVNGVMA